MSETICADDWTAVLEVRGLCFPSTLCLRAKSLGQEGADPVVTRSPRSNAISSTCVCDGIRLAGTCLRCRSALPQCPHVLSCFVRLTMANISEIIFFKMRFQEIGVERGLLMVA